MARHRKRLASLLFCSTAHTTKPIYLLSKGADDLRDTYENVTEMIPTSIIRIWFLGLF